MDCMNPMKIRYPMIGGPWICISDDSTDGRTDCRTHRRSRNSSTRSCKSETLTSEITRSLSEAGFELTTPGSQLKMKAAGGRDAPDSRNGEPSQSEMNLGGYSASFSPARTKAFYEYISSIYYANHRSF